VPFNTLTINGKLVWECTRYQDLTRDRINNLAMYGQPFSPGEVNYKTDLIPDFAHVTVRMSHFEVMNKGYGQTIKPENFPLVRLFLMGGLDLPIKSYSVDDVLKQAIKQTGKKYKRFISKSLYNKQGHHSLENGLNTSYIDATYVHGTVGFALMKKGTQFIVEEGHYKVIAYIGASTDDWNFQSSNSLVQVVNPLVSLTLGPKTNNLQQTAVEENEGIEARIMFEYVGTGKRMVVSKGKKEKPLGRKERRYIHSFQ